MIPDFVDIGSPWKILPPGIHKATMKEIEACFAISEHRKQLFLGLQEGVRALCNAGCRIILLDGSFITEKPTPKDYDVCWDPRGVDISKLDPVFSISQISEKNKKCVIMENFFRLVLKLMA
jgi:hypothetical protein